MSNKSLYLVTLVFVFFPMDIFSQSSWEIDMNKDGIVVYTRNEVDSDFKSFKAVTLVDASGSEVIKLLRNADGYTNWFGFTKTSKVLEQEGNTQYNYVETIFPWPYKNRDMIYKMSIDTSSPKVIEISLEGIPHYIPEKKKIVRMEKASGYMLLNTTGNKTEVTYVFHSEPGGKIPVRLANNSIAELPYKTLTGLKKILEKTN